MMSKQVIQCLFYRAGTLLKSLGKTLKIYPDVTVTKCTDMVQKEHIK